MDWLQRIIETVRREGAVARVLIVETDGPTPRAAGSSMLVWAGGHAGKIGRGEVEAHAIAAARDLIGQVLANRTGRPCWLREPLRYATGDVLGECSGGTVLLMVEAFGAAEADMLQKASVTWPRDPVLARRLETGTAPAVLDAREAVAAGLWQEGLDILAAEPQRQVLRWVAPGGADLVIERITQQRPPFYVYGSGLVARALVQLLADLPFEVTWLDTAPGHFPPEVPDGVATRVSTDLAEWARKTQPGGFHAVMTAAHDLDLAVTQAVLQAGQFAFLGVIGSRLKAERLHARLREAGVAEADLQRIQCPIGLPQIRSKQPAVIAVGIAAQVLAVLPGALPGALPVERRYGRPAGSKA